MGVDVLALLAEMPLLKDVEVEQLAALDIRANLRNLDSGQILFDQADQSRDVYFLVSGRLLVVHWTEDGREMVFGRIDVRTHLGELAAIDNGKRSLSVYAHREAQVLVLSQSDFQSLMDNVPVVRQRVIQGLVANVRRLTERLYQANLFTVERRVRSYLVRLALEAGQMHPGGAILDAPTHSEIANWVGSNREVVSRVMSGLKKSGIINTKRKQITLVEPDLLLKALSD